MDLLRLTIALGDNESKRFNKILSSIIIYVLHNVSEDHFYSNEEIQNFISKEFELCFSTYEIETAVEDNLDLFLVIKEGVSKKYKLSDKAISKVENNKIISLADCVDTFVRSNIKKLDEIGIKNEQEIGGILTKYFYRTFDNDKNELISLLKGEADVSNDYTKKIYTKKEIAIIKLFLDWDNEQKNVLVFNLVRTAYDYCILTLKENADDTIFSHKKLFLDANVIFSLTGINGKERMQSTNAFILKSKQLKSSLFFTSETSDECRNTLIHLINQMASIIKKESFLSYDELKAVFPSSNPAALYSLYLDWSKNKPSRNGDYNGFTSFMLEKLNETLDTLTLIPIEMRFIEKNSELISNFQTSIKNFKDGLGRKHSDSAAYVDACNYAYIDSIRNKTTSTLNKQDIFFVSCDTGLCKWSQNQCAGYISVFMHPSIMYSLMLRFSSRTKDDYKTFNDFLSLNFSNNFIIEDNFSVKEDMINAIEELEMPTDAKKKILYSANKRLNNLARKNDNIISEEDVKMVVDKAIDNYYYEFEEKKDKEKEQAVNNASKTNYTKGFDDALYAISLKNVEKKIKKKKIFGWLITIGLFVILGIFTTICIVVFVREGDIKTKSGWILASFSLIAFVSFVVTLILNIKKKLFNTSSSDLLKKEIENNKKTAYK